jgi:methanethiol S-methyltransferase
MNNIHLILTLNWILYCIFHSLLANTSVKNFFSRLFKLGLTLYRFIYNIVALLWLVLLVYFHFTVDSYLLFQVNLITNVIAWVALLAGAGIMMVCIKKYFNQLSGLKDQAKTEKLQTNGLHQWVRHPLYFGTFVFLIGLLLMFPQLKNVIAVVIIISYTLAGTLLEEKKLILQFGEDYIKYQKSVPMIWPRIKLR